MIDQPMGNDDYEEDEDEEVSEIHLSLCGHLITLTDDVQLLTEEQIAEHFEAFQLSQE